MATKTVSGEKARSLSHVASMPALGSNTAKLKAVVTELEETVKTKTRELQRVEHINRYLVMGQQKRDEIITSALEENRKLKENVRWFQRMVANGKKVSNAGDEGSMGDNSKRKDQNSSSTTSSQEIVNLRRTVHRLQDELQRKDELLKDKKNRLGSRQNTSDSNREVEKENAVNKPRSFLNGDDGNMPFNWGKQAIFEDVFDDANTFMDRLTVMDHSMRIELVDSLRTQRRDFRNLIDLTLRLRKLIKGTHSISVSLELNEAMDRIVNEACEILNCDRGTVFMVDELNAELWSKVAKGSASTIRIPIDKGIVGFVATTGKPLNIEDAYADPRFNQSVDRANNYRTKSILCLPIRDPSGHVIGVIQAINKNEGVFSADDEALLELLSAQAGIMLRNSIKFDKTMMYQHKLRHCLEVGVKILSCVGLAEALPVAEQMVKELMNVDKAVIYTVDDSRAHMIRHLEGGETHSFPIQAGIAGHVAITGEMLNVADAYNDVRFNGNVDLETSMPVLAMPIRNHESILGVLEVVNTRGVVGRASCSRAKVDPIDSEVMEHLNKYIAVTIDIAKRLAEKSIS